KQGADATPGSKHLAFSRVPARTACSSLKWRPFAPRTRLSWSLAAPQAVTQRARTLALEGERLIELKHYAVDSIRPKCHELRQLCDQFAADVGRRRGLLGRALDLHSLLEASMKWCDEGIYLLASQPVDKCQAQDGAEAALQEVEKFLETRAENKIQELSKIYQDYEPILTRDLLEHVQKVFRKQESVEEMFHRRQASLKKLAAKQTRPVQPVAPRPEAPAKSPCPSPGTGSCTFSFLKARCGPLLSPQSEVSEGRQGRGRSTGDEESLAVLRRHVMNELLDTERVYVEELLCILEGYAAEMDNPLMTHLISTGLQNKKDVLFGNMEEIYHFHNRIFLRELENYIDCPELVGRCFLERMEQFQVYEKYCQNKPRSESLWRQCSDCPFFQECQKKLDHKLSLDSYLLKPVQRITKYQLLLKEMLKYSKSCEGAEDLQEALSSILGILKAVNDSMHLIAITGYEGNLSDLGKLLMQGSFSVWTDHKKGHAKVKDLARFKPMQRHLFLHEKAVLFCKKREENGEGYEKAPSYSFKQSLNMTAVGITENVKGDAKKFEIWYNAREEVYIVQAPTPEIKAAWVSEIRKVLTSQLQACREASQHRALEQSHSLPLPAPAGTSPSKGNTKDVRKLEERKTDPLNLEGYVGPAPLPRPPEKDRDDAVTSSTSESSALSKKRFTLQSFAALKGQKASPTSPDKKAKRHQVKSDPTPFGLRGRVAPPPGLAWRHFPIRLGTLYRGDVTLLGPRPQARCAQNAQSCPQATRWQLTPGWCLGWAGLSYSVAAGLHVPGPSFLTVCPHASGDADRWGEVLYWNSGLCLSCPHILRAEPPPPGKPKAPHLHPAQVEGLRLADRISLCELSRASQTT
uniref:DH domain-containing protein n=1 Tax=Monodon monoceros TaxID=40151 RepID=A0A8C6ATR2_MONMO